MFLKLGADFASLFRRNTGPQGSRRNYRPFKHHRPGRNDRMRSDDCTVQYDRIHTNQGAGLNVGPMDGCIVTNAGALIDAGFAFVECTVDDSAVLDVYPRPNGNRSDISADDAIEPTR